jgi:DNA repair ATPase RecN
VFVSRSDESTTAAPTDNPFGRARTAVRIFAAVAVVGAVVALVIGERAANQVERGLAIASDAAQAAAEASEPAESIAAELANLTATVATATADAREVAAASAVALDRVGLASTTNIADTLDGAADAANRLASAVEQIERFIPGNQQPSAADELRAVADGLEPVPGQLRSLGNDLITAADRIEVVNADLEAVETRLTTIAERVEDARDTIGGLPPLVASIERQIDAVESSMTLDRWLARLGIVAALALLLALAYGTDRFTHALEAATRAGAAAPPAT